MSDSNKTTFEPVHPFNLEDPKSWAETIGNLDWDKTRITFSKRELLEFLKQAGVSVGTNYKEISKLPKYASFGYFNKEATDEAVKDLVEAEIADPHTEDDASKYRPTRKVTQNPGGESHIKMFQGEYESEEALSLAPPKPGQGQGEGVTITHRERAEFSGVDVGDRGDDQEEAFRPTRKVRENPGGNSSMAGNLFSGFGGN